ASSATGSTSPWTRCVAWRQSEPRAAPRSTSAPELARRAPRGRANRGAGLRSSDPGRENRADQGRRPSGEASVAVTYVSETLGRGRRDAKVCSGLDGRSWTRTRDLLLIREAL